MNAGQYDQRITVQAPPTGRGGLGQASGAWTDVASMWARAEPIRGREFFAAGQMQSEAAVRFTVRYRVDVDHTMRVVWRGLAHAIVAPPMDVGGRNVDLELMCAAGVRDG